MASCKVARLEGIEPPTHGLEGRCSIRLSYRRAYLTVARPSRRSGGRADRAGWEGWSGRADLNGRPPAPKAGALPGCATPRRLILHYLERGWPPRREVPHRQPCKDRVAGEAIPSEVHLEERRLPSSSEKLSMPTKSPGSQHRRDQAEALERADLDVALARAKE